MNEENKINYYAIIPATVRYDKNLKPAEKLLYGEITALANKNGYCYAKNRYFANLYEVSIETVSRWISHLQQLGYIKIKVVRNENKEVIERYIYITDISLNIQCSIDKKVNTLLTEKSIPPIDKKINTYCKKHQYPIDENVKENNINNNKIDDLFYYIINKDSKISNDFYKIIERLEFNYTEEMLFMLNEANLQIIKNVIYVLYELHNSEFSLLLLNVNRESLFDIYRKSQEHNPKDFLNYYKKAIINKYNNTS